MQEYQQRMKEITMKQHKKNIDGDEVTIIQEPCDYLDDDIPENLHLDWDKARPNPYAKMLNEQKKVLIQLDPDVAKYFRSSEQVNNYLRKHLHIPC